MSNCHRSNNNSIQEVTDMFHKAIDMEFLDGTALAVTFQDGAVKRYDMRALFPKYPQLKALEDRGLFLSTHPLTLSRLHVHLRGCRRSSWLP